MKKMSFILISILACAVSSFALEDPEKDCTTLIQQVISDPADAIAAQDFETANDQYDTFVADDFTVPPGKIWSIESIDFYGYCGWSTLHEAINLHCHVFANSASDEPDGIPVYDPRAIWHEAWPPSDPNVTFIDDCSVSVTPGPPPIFGPGTYWLACYPEMSFADAGQWYWIPSYANNGFTAKANNPGGGFGFPSGWNDIDSGIIPIDEKDMAFTLCGYIYSTTTSTSTTTTHPSTTTTVPSTTSTTTSTFTADDDSANDDTAEDDSAADDASDDSMPSDDSGNEIPGDDSGGGFTASGHFAGSGSSGCGC